MFRPKRMATDGKGFRELFVTLLTIVLGILWIAQPVAVRAVNNTDMSEKIDVKDKDGNPKKWTISYSYDANSPATLKNATIKATPTSASEPQPISEAAVSLPVKLGGHTKNLVAVYPGPIPIIVFDGSGSCVWVRDHWVHPPGVTCP